MKKTEKNANVNKSTATATETAKPIANNEKTNIILNIDGVKKLFIECNVLPKYTDRTHYVGTGIRSNVFSVNVTKSQYNVYVDDIVYKTLNENKINGCTYTVNGNSSSKTIPNKIEVNTTDNLKKLLQCVASNYKMYTIA
jgi:hypothetical protein